MILLHQRSSCFVHRLCGMESNALQRSLRLQDMSVLVQNDWVFKNICRRNENNQTNVATWSTFTKNIRQCIMDVCFKLSLQNLGCPTKWRLNLKRRKGRLLFIDDILLQSAQHGRLSHKTYPNWLAMIGYYRELYVLYRIISYYATWVIGDY